MAGRNRKGTGVSLRPPSVPPLPPRLPLVPRMGTRTAGSPGPLCPRRPRPPASRRLRPRNGCLQAPKFLFPKCSFLVFSSPPESDTQTPPACIRSWAIHGLVPPAPLPVTCPEGEVTVWPRAGAPQPPCMPGAGWCWCQGPQGFVGKPQPGAAPCLLGGHPERRGSRGPADSSLVNPLALLLEAAGRPGRGGLKTLFLYM